MDIWLVKFLDYSFFEGLDELEKVVCNNSLRNSVIHFEIELLDSFLESIKFNDYQKILAFDIDHSLLNTIVSSAFMFLAYDLLGLAQVYCTRKPNKAIEYFQMSEAYIKGDNRYRLSAINKYHVILAVMADMDHISALSLFDSCFIALQKVGAYRRMAYMEIYKGVCFQNLGLFNQAENIYKNIEAKIPQVDIPDIKKCINENLMWLYLKDERYQESQECVELARTYGSVFPDLSLASAWSSYNLDSPSKCKEIIKHEIGLLSETQRSEFVKSVLLLMISALERESTALEKQYRKIEESLPRFQNVEADYIVYSIMGDYYTKNEDYQSAFAFEKKKVEYLLQQS